MTTFDKISIAAAGMLAAALFVPVTLAAEPGPAPVVAGPVTELPACDAAVVAGPACGLAAGAPGCGVLACDPSCGVGHHCARCGGCNGCCQVCRLVCKEKELKVTCWASECKPFCVPCPSCQGGKNAECVDCAHGGNGGSKKLVWWDWCPGDAKVHSKKVLLKKEVKKKVPSYEWVIENLCAACQSAGEAQPIPPGADVPPPPKSAARVLHGLAPGEKLSAISPH